MFSLHGFHFLYLKNPWESNKLPRTIFFFFNIINFQQHAPFSVIQHVRQFLTKNMADYITDFLVLSLTRLIHTPNIYTSLILYFLDPRDFKANSYLFLFYYSTEVNLILEFCSKIILNLFYLLLKYIHWELTWNLNEIR